MRFNASSRCLGIVLALLGLGLGFGATAQEAPPASGPELAPHQVEGLVLLGKVWGFLKYHHPAVTAGEGDWDAALFEALPAVLEAGDLQAARGEVTAWALELGLPDAVEPAPPEPEGAYGLADLEWTRDAEALGEALSAFLQDVHARRHAGGPQRYVRLNRGVKNADFSAEKAYADLEEVDLAHRLLALFRFWNILQYWAPYRDLVEGDWHAVLAEFVPRVAAARERLDYELVLMELTARVADGHTNLWSSLASRPPRGTARLPVNLRFVEGRAVVTQRLADPSGVWPAGGLLAGDLLRSIDGRDVDGLVEAWSPLYAASNQPTRLRDLGNALGRGRPGPARLVVERDGKRLEVTEDRVPLEDVIGLWTHDLPGETFRLLGPDVAYLKLSTVKQDDCPDYVNRAQGTRGWVIDIRNYPSEFVVFTLGRHLVAEATPFARFTTPDLGNPGAFVWTEPISLTPKEPTYGGRVVILVDEVSQSQAEYTTMAFRAAPDALVVGSTTAGADGNVSNIPLPGGLRSMISGIGVFYPDKTPTQRIGILPDVEVRPTLAGLAAGRDEVLEEALRQILGEGTPEEEIRRLARPTAAGDGR